MGFEFSLYKKDFLMKNDFLRNEEYEIKQQRQN